MSKIWCVQAPVFGSIFLISILSQAGVAAELPANQPVSTPDQAVRRMAAAMVIESKTAGAAALQSPANNSNRVFSARSITAAKASFVPSPIFSNCPNNSCGFIATQPPVSLGTVVPLGISKIPQNKLVSPGISNSLDSPRQQPITPTPNEPIENAAKAVLGQELGAVDKEKSVEQPVKAVEVTATQASVFTQPANKQLIGIDIQQQIAFFKDRLVESSRQFVTALPKPQIDSSLLNIGNSIQPTVLSFSPRLTLGNTATNNHQNQVQPLESLLAIAKETSATNSLTITKSFSMLPAFTTPTALNRPVSIDSSSTIKTPTKFFVQLSSFQPAHSPLISNKL
jgi:hypothetical protein